MSRDRLGRNDPCFCGSGKKYKRCCYPRTLPDLRLPNAGVPDPRIAHPPIHDTQPAGGNEKVRMDAIDVGRTRVRCVPMPPYGDGAALAGTLAPPTPDQIRCKYEAVRAGNPRRATEVLLAYNYPEPFGLADVQMVFDADEQFQSRDGRAVGVLDLFRGMQVELTDGAVGTVTANPQLRWDTPEPPSPNADGSWYSRVVGQVRHTAYEVLELRMAGQLIRGTPGHLMWSEGRRGWVRACELMRGEVVRLTGGILTPVEQVGPLRSGRVEVFGIEVEYFHNYFIGSGGNAMLVHNGPECLTKPRIYEAADEGGGGRSFKDQAGDFQKDPGKWEPVSVHTEPSTRKGARQSGVSIQTQYRNSETGETIWQHTVVDDRGKIVDDHPRPNFKPRAGEI